MVQLLELFFPWLALDATEKNLANSVPLIIGASLASLISISDINSPVTVVCILFSTGLAPISGYYGWPYGIIAGFLHIFMVLILVNYMED